MELQANLAGESARLAEEVAAAAEHRVKSRDYFCRFVTSRVAEDAHRLAWIILHSWCATAKASPVDARGILELEETIWNLRLRRNGLEEALEITHARRAQLLGEMRKTEARHRVNDEKRFGSSQAVARAQDELRALKEDTKIRAAEVRSIRNTLAKRWSLKEAGLNRLRLELAADTCMNQRADIARIETDQNKLRGRLGISLPHANSFLQRRRSGSFYAGKLFWERSGSKVSAFRLRMSFDNWRLSALQCKDLRKLQSLSEDFAASTEVYDTKIPGARARAQVMEVAAAQAVTKARAAEDAVNDIVLPTVRIDDSLTQQKKTAEIINLRRELHVLHSDVAQQRQTLAREESESPEVVAAQEVAAFETAVSIHQEEMTPSELVAERALEKGEVTCWALN